MHTTEGAQPDRPLLLRIHPDVTTLTSLGRSTIYSEIAAGRLRAIKIGRAVRVRRDDLDRWLESRSAEIQPDQAA